LGIASRRASRTPLLPSSFHQSSLSITMAISFSLPLVTVTVCLLSMSKRKATPTPSSSKQLNLYRKNYKGGGAKDAHLLVFRQMLEWASKSKIEEAETTSNRRVFYPGCHRHLTASLVFPDVTFMDYDSKVEPLYTEAAVKEYVDTNKIYAEDAHYRFICHNVDQTMERLLELGSFDLLISLSAGLLVQPCTPYVARHGYLLVNDSHSDARAAFVSGDWELKAYWDEETKSFSDLKLDQCFQVKKPKSTETVPISLDQVKESVEVGTVRNRSFKMLFEPRFFIFEKK